MAIQNAPRPEKLKLILSDIIEPFEEISVRLSKAINSFRFRYFDVDFYDFKKPTIEEILSVSEQDLLKKRDFGKTTLNELKGILASKGIPLDNKLFQNAGQYLSPVSPLTREVIERGEEIYNQLIEYFPFREAIKHYQSQNKKINSFREYLNYIENNVESQDLLEKLFIKSLGKAQLKKYQISLLVRQGFTRREITEKIGSSYSYVSGVISKNEDLLSIIQKEGRTDQKVYEEIKNLLLEGKNQNQIASLRGVTRQAINEYLTNHPELKKLYEQK